MKKAPKKPALYDAIVKGVKARMGDTAIAEQLGVKRQYIYKIRTKFNIKAPKPVDLSTMK